MTSEILTYGCHLDSVGKNCAVAKAITLFLERAPVATPNAPLNGRDTLSRHCTFRPWHGRATYCIRFGAENAALKSGFYGINWNASSAAILAGAAFTLLFFFCTTVKAVLRASWSGRVWITWCNRPWDSNQPCRGRHSSRHGQIPGERHPHGDSRAVLKAGESASPVKKSARKPQQTREVEPAREARTGARLTLEAIA